ncbi:hypothetical protein GCM10009660_27670 [Catellatospora bangladeshensis]|uniref:Uncharacterized protein n=1 Tax=Saccharothrix algeriensis TaxID=173560 RepID=A0ABS2S249_9PSEU|nr:hypothetical protein [Saccharothrix algeriensis]
MTRYRSPRPLRPSCLPAPRRHGPPRRRAAAPAPPRTRRSRLRAVGSALVKGASLVVGISNLVLDHVIPWFSRRG